MKAIVGSEILGLAIDQLRIDLAALVAECAFWPPQEPSATIPDSPNTRRARAGEKRGDLTADGIRLDDNTYANAALKRALRHVGKFEGFAVCHVWAKSCYDARYHTLPANLVLLPRELAGLTDHNQHIEACLRYRAWELYKWHPDEEAPPPKPDAYPTNWRMPIRSESQSHQFKRPSQTTQGCSTGGNPLPIDLTPKQPDKFRDAFIKAGVATISIHYDDGRIERRSWKCRKMSSSSDVLGNLRSRPELRNGAWQRLGISRVTVETSGGKVGHGGS